MKNTLKIIAAAAVAASLFGCSSSNNAEGDHLARIQAEGKMTVGLEGNWQPFCFHDEEDVLVGYDVEVAQNIGEKLGVEIVFVEGDWSGLLTGLTAGTYDLVINGVEINDDRKQSYDFSDPYMYDRAVLVVRTDNTEITCFEDLKGKKTANSIGSSYEKLGETYGAEVKGVESLAETMTLVKSGQVDATINASTSVQDYIATTGDTEIMVVDQTEEASQIGIPLPKGDDNKTLMEAINKALKEMREDGTLAEISMKYFGADLTN